MIKAYKMCCQPAVRQTNPKNNVFQPSLFVFFLIFLFPAIGSSQPELVCDGNVQTISYSGTFKDFIIPNDPAINEIEFTLKGGDGGFAQIGNACKADGGEGATVIAKFKVGEGADALPYGAIVRLVVGRAGEKGTGVGILFTGGSYGGGGGGTGLLYKMPGDELWTILAVAGGGGGAYQGRLAGFCIDKKEGQGGSATVAGGNGNGSLNPGEGGTFGDGGLAGGLNGLELSGGGGGYLTRGSGISCTGGEVGEGGAGYPEGGYGGGAEGCFSFTFRDGGYGFGGGGTGNNGGGGGGGYSGGGGGGSTGAGGGGGSYVRAANAGRTITAGGTTGDTFDGFATYTCQRKSAPVAVCMPTPVTVILNDAGHALISLSQIDGGTIEASTGEVAISFGPANFDCDDIGENSVTLTVTADSGQASSCTATVIVEDQTLPVAECEAVSVFLDENGQANITAEQIGGNSYDACGIADMQLSTNSFDCSSLGEQTVSLLVTDNNGNTNSCFITLKVKDESAISISCPADQVVTCGQSTDPALLGTASASDNCSAPVLSFLDEGGADFCGEGGTLLRTWTASAEGQAAASCVQQIAIQKDNTPPSISCPENISVACNATDLPDLEPIVADNCDSAPLVSFDDFTIGNEGDFSYTIERTWMATDACGNVNSCIQTIKKSAALLADEALNIDVDGDGEADPIVIGRMNRNALIITPAAAACVLEWLPSATGNSRPLPRGNTIVDGTNCIPGRIPLNDEGRLTNPLLGQAIQLAITLRLNPEIASVPLSTLSCMTEVSDIVYQGLPRPNPTIGDLFQQSNLILGNIYAPHWQHFENALHCINSVYGLCKPEETAVAELHHQLGNPQVSNQAFSMELFPNPASEVIYLQFHKTLEQLAVLRIYNLQGQLVLNQTIPAGASMQHRIPLANLGNGLYKMWLQIEGETSITRSFVVQR